MDSYKWSFKTKLSSFLGLGFIANYYSFVIRYEKLKFPIKITWQTQQV